MSWLFPRLDSKEYQEVDTEGWGSLVPNSVATNVSLWISADPPVLTCRTAAGEIINSVAATFFDPESTDNVVVWIEGKYYYLRDRQLHVYDPETKIIDKLEYTDVANLAAYNHSLFLENSTFITVIDTRERALVLKCRKPQQESQLCEIDTSGFTLYHEEHATGKLQFTKIQWNGELALRQPSFVGARVGDMYQTMLHGDKLVQYWWYYTTTPVCGSYIRVTDTNCVARFYNWLHTSYGLTYRYGPYNVHHKGFAIDTSGQLYLYR